MVMRGLRSLALMYSKPGYSARPPFIACISPLYEITGSVLKLCYLNARSVHKHIQDIHSDLNYLSAELILTFLQKQGLGFKILMRCIIFLVMSSFEMSSNSSNASRPYGGTAVYSKIPCLPGYPCCNNIHGIKFRACLHGDRVTLLRGSPFYKGQKIARPPLHAKSCP